MILSNSYNLFLLGNLQLESGMEGYRAFSLFVAKHNPAAMMQRSAYDVECLGPVRLDPAWLRSFYERVRDIYLNPLILTGLSDPCFLPPPTTGRHGMMSSDPL